MESGMFTALFGALANEHRLNSITNNLANVHTTGYKREMLAFKDTYFRFAHDQIMEPIPNIRAKPLFPDPQHKARARIAEGVIDFQQGGLKGSGDPLDVAISGSGFFKIQTPDGNTFYTRNGHFRLDSEGRLVSEQGYTVVGEGGEILVPVGTRNVTIAEDGRLFADEALAGQISLVDVDEPAFLERQGQNLYRVRPGEEVAEMPPERGYMVQGFLEAPNVDAVYEMVNMIEAHRQFEAYAKVMQASQQMDSEATSKVGRAR